MRAVVPLQCGAEKMTKNFAYTKVAVYCKENKRDTPDTQHVHITKLQVFSHTFGTRSAHTCTQIQLLIKDRYLNHTHLLSLEDVNQLHLFLECCNEFTLLMVQSLVLHHQLLHSLSLLLAHLLCACVPRKTNMKNIAC